MKTLYVLLLAFIIPTLLNAQGLKYDTQQAALDSGSLQVANGITQAGEWAYRTRDAYTDLRYNVGRTLSDYEYKTIIGNSYYKKEFAIGKIYINNKAISKTFTLRYNAFSDEIEVGTSLKFEALINNLDISCLIGKDIYIYHPYVRKEGEDTQTGYLKAIFKGSDISLLIRETKMFKEGVKAQTTLETSFPAKLIDVKEFYILKASNKNAVLLKQKNKKVLEIIDTQYKSEMSLHLKDNNLNVKNDKDLITFFKHYNSLTLSE